MKIRYPNKIEKTPLNNLTMIEMINMDSGCLETSLVSLSEEANSIFEEGRVCLSSLTIHAKMRIKKKFPNTSRFLSPGAYYFPEGDTSTFIIGERSN